MIYPSFLQQQENQRTRELEKAARAAKNEKWGPQREGHTILLLYCEEKWESKYERDTSYLSQTAEINQESRKRDTYFHNLILWRDMRDKYERDTHLYNTVESYKGLKWCKVGHQQKNPV